MNKFNLLLLCLFAFVSCGYSEREYQALLNENRELKAQVEEYKFELEQYKNTPDVLYAQAKQYIQNKDITKLSEVCDALKKYHPFSQECAKAVKSLNELNKQNEAKIAAELSKRRQAVTKLKKKYDDITSISWYYNPYFTHYNNSNHASIYMGQKGSEKPWLRLEMSYCGSDWIFFDSAYLSYDGNTLQIPFNEYRDKESDNSGSNVWEWIDVPVSDDILGFLKRMVDGKVVKMRLTGKYSYTKTLSSTEVNAIKDVLLGYDVLVKGE